MKLNITRKHAKALGLPIIELGYCEIQRLLDIAGYEPTYYTSGVYGWNSDLYVIHLKDGRTAIICTGYRPFGTVEPTSGMRRRIHETNERPDKWRGRNWERRKSDAQRVIDEMVTEILFFGKYK